MAEYRVFDEGTEPNRVAIAVLMIRDENCLDICFLTIVTVVSRFIRDVLQHSISQRFH